MSQAYYSNTVKEFLEEDNASIKVKLDDASVQFSQIWTIQFTSWYSSIGILKDQLTELTAEIPEALDWTILFEYEVPRLLSRIDIVLIAGNMIFVVEFKLDRKSFDYADVRQVEDYALDLKDFHLQSRDRIIVPVLLAPLAKSNEQFTAMDGTNYVRPAIKANEKDLGLLLLKSYLDNRIGNNDIDAAKWIASVYSPTPTIIQAAQALFAGQKVEAITKYTAANLSVTTDYLLDIISKTKTEHTKVICFVTGVPGAGKTLVGLNVIHKDGIEDKTNKAYFSGNGPLINVLTEALTRDEYHRDKAKVIKSETSLNKDAIRRKIKSKVQNLHNFIKDNIAKEVAPIEQIVVFDEAQRCWDAVNFYNKSVQSRVKNEHLQIKKSEAEIIFEVMDRHEDWAVIIALIGNGQEINTGEAGIGEWGKVLKERYSHWNIYISPELLQGDPDNAISSLFEDVPAHLMITTNHNLHLSESQRSFKASNLNDWVNAVIDNDTVSASEIYKDIQGKYPIFITRSLVTAKEYLRNLKQGNKRIGLVASSGGLRLRPYGINTREDIDVAYWFLNDEQDVRSSDYLEIVATEYKIQGLEIDWVGVCWDADLRRADNEWNFKSFSGTSWHNVNSIDDRQFLLNKYRVLLTRAREGMIIWVPEGDVTDHTRLPEIYDLIYDYLKACGIKEI